MHDQDRDRALDLGRVAADLAADIVDLVAQRQVRRQAVAERLAPRVPGGDVRQRDREHPFAGRPDHAAAAHPGAGRAAAARRVEG